MKKLLAYFALSLGPILFSLYWARPNWATAVTIFPAWAWLCIWALAMPAFRKKVFIATSIVWITFALTFVEELRSLGRSILPKEATTCELRVLTVNCSGSIIALESSLIEEPDIILIQETPQENQVLELIEGSPDYQYAHGVDTSILVKGTISEELHKEFYYNTVIAEVKEQRYHITSLRLATSNPRMDLWNPDCWKKQQWKRERQIEQIKQIRSTLTIDQDTPIIMGGDFNVPQGDRVFKSIHSDLKDSFSTGGRGWCNTIIAELPLLRIDQIWTDESLNCNNAYVNKVKATDHKLYVAEFVQEN